MSLSRPVMKSVSIGAQTVRYVEGGLPNSRRALLLFNGIGARIEIAMPFIAKFERTRVIAFDLPGVGVSIRTRYRYDLHVSAPRRIRLPSGISREIRHDM